MDRFEMKSAHATEAIAALVGFKTYAALKANLKLVRSEIAYEVDFDAFENRSAEFGYERISSEFLRFSYSNIQWPNAPWCFLSKPELSRRDGWFAECERRQIPFMTITKARVYCSFQWDHGSLDSDYDRLARRVCGGELERILYKNYRLLAARNEPKSFFDGSALFGQITGLSEATARQIANRFSFLLFPGNLQLVAAA